MQRGQQRPEREQVLAEAARRRVIQALTQETEGKLPSHCVSQSKHPSHLSTHLTSTFLMASSSSSGEVRFPPCWELESCRAPRIRCENGRVKLCQPDCLRPRAVPSTAGKKPREAVTVLNNILLITYLLLVGFILLVNPVSRPRISNSLQQRMDNTEERHRASWVCLQAPRCGKTAASFLSSPLRTRRGECKNPTPLLARSFLPSAPWPNPHASRIASFPAAKHPLSSLRTQTHSSLLT